MATRSAPVSLAKRVLLRGVAGPHRGSPSCRPAEQVKAQYDSMPAPTPAVCRPDRSCPGPGHHTAGTRSGCYGLRHDRASRCVSLVARLVAKPPFPPTRSNPSNDTLPHIPVSPCSDKKIKSPFYSPPREPPDVSELPQEGGLHFTTSKNQSAYYQGFSVHEPF
ncbi:hypothetical protein GWK47_048458 [Chionoecetes opilio]|uniref:Uncharacterized protein n=1 Tax=Chionoecetes opilio TaxID=41210 RepID=A0A8J4YB21_CHIOP|nr:hypothetical protein GWK47_048458 [Chionoecetes opilio]